MRVEKYFLRYAFPCAFVIRARNEIDDAAYSELEDAAVKGKLIEKDKLEKIFNRAFAELSRIAKERGKNKWDPSVIRHYFLNEHNKIIDRREGSYKNFPPTLCELSKVLVGEIIEKNNDILSVKIKDKIRRVLNHFVPEAKEGDKVTVHYGYAVEVVD